MFTCVITNIMNLFSQHYKKITQDCVTSLQLVNDLKNPVIKYIFPNLKDLNLLKT